MKSIQAKITVTLILVIASIIILSSTSTEYMLSRIYSYTSTLLEKQISEREITVEKVVKSKVEDIVKSSVLFATQLSLEPSVIEGVMTNNKDIIHQSLAKHTEIAMKEAGIDLIWITRLQDRTPEGNTPILACPSNPAFDGFDKLNYQSTNEALNSGKTVASWETNEEDGKLQVTVPIMNEGQVIGAVVVGKQTYQGFIKQIAEASGTGSTLFLVAGDNDYYVMTDSQTDEIGSLFFQDSHESLKDKAVNLSILMKEKSVYTELKLLLDETQSTRKAFTKTIVLNNEPYIIYSEPLLTFNNKVAGVMLYRFPGIISSKNSFNEVVRSIKTTYYLIAVLLFLACVSISYFSARKISNPIKKLHSISKQIAKGDLTKESDVQSKDEIGQLSGAFNEMIHNLRGLVSNIVQSSGEITSTSFDLSTSTEQNSKATEQIASTIQSISEDASAQANMVYESSSVNSQLFTSIQQVSKNAQFVSDASKQASWFAREGNKQIHETISQMNTINRVVQDTSGVISELGEKSKQIGQIVDVINNISGQTNLLALNAAIEAARAGDQGKGFAVVANEVRKLAEQSEEATKSIAAIVTEIQNDSRRAIDSMKKGTEAVGSGINVVNDAGNAFAKILSAIEEVSDKIQQVSLSLLSMTDDSKLVVENMNQVLEISKKSSTNISTIASATEEQTASMEEIASLSNTLSSMSDELNKLVERFRLA